MFNTVKRAASEVKHMMDHSAFSKPTCSFTRVSRHACICTSCAPKMHVCLHEPSNTHTPHMCLSLSQNLVTFSQAWPQKLVNMTVDLLCSSLRAKHFIYLLTLTGSTAALSVFWAYNHIPSFDVLQFFISIRYTLFGQSF